VGVTKSSWRLGCHDIFAFFATQREMAGYLKTTCKVKQMVTSGNEGYR
jgi:hypothetical protein